MTSEIKQTLKEVVKLAVPSIITNITTPLLGLVDLAIAGHIGDDTHGSALFIAAIAVGSGMFTMLYWLFAFLRMGTGGITAQASGAGDKPAMDFALVHSLIVAVAIGALITILSRPIGEGILMFMNPEPATLPLARRYIAICAWGAPAMLSTFALTGWFIGRQDTRSPMWVSVIVNLTNIAASLVMAVFMGMKIRGVAFGTLTAQWVGFIASMTFCVILYRPHLPHLRDILDAARLRRFFTVNRDIFLRTLCMVSVTLWFTRTGARQGEVMLAVNALLMQLFLTFSYFMDGFAFAGESLCGQAYGRRDFPSLRRVAGIVMGCGGALAVIFTILYLVGGEWFLRVMSDDPRVAVASSDYFLWAVSVPLVGFTAFSLDAVAIGITATGRMLLSALSGAVIFFAVYVLSFPAMANNGLWLAFTLYLAARGVSLAILLRPLLNQR